MEASAAVDDRRHVRAAVLPPSITAGMLVAAAALLFHPYRGLFGDARIYVGRAIATLDPAGVGRDLMFVHDRQSAFSVFPALLTWAVSLLGPTTAAALTSLAALTAWTLAAVAAATAFAGRRDALLSILGLLILPSAYSGFQMVTGEAAPLPRPVAEMLVLLGLWTLLRGRTWPAAGLMALAAAVHPIMAAPGLGVVYLVLCLENRRWFLLAGLGAAALAACAALRLPLLDRLPEVMDVRWSAVLRVCSPSLFLRTWPGEAWSQVVVRATTLGLAAALLDGRARRVAVATLAVTAAALGASALLGDVLGSVLVLQAQVWRALWLLSVLSAAALPLVAMRFWTRGPVARLAIGFLACAWVATAVAPLSVGASAASLLLVLLSVRGVAASRAVMALGWALAGSAAALIVVGEGSVLSSLVWEVPEALRQPLRFYLREDMVRVVVMAAVLGAAAWKGAGRQVVGRIATPATALLLLAAVMSWPSLSASRRLVQSRSAAREVHALTAPRPGEVLWLGGDVEPMMLAGRPGWWTQVQAASSVFSREQALLWAERRDRLVTTGLGPPGLLVPFPDQPHLFWAATPAHLQAFCAFADAPAWIVQPLRARDPTPAGSRLWRAPIAAPRVLSPGAEPELAWTYAFIPCRKPERRPAEVGDARQERSPA